MHFEVGNSTTAGNNVLCNTITKAKSSNKFRSVICGNRRMIGKYAIFYGDGDYYFKEFQVYGWENVWMNKYFFSVIIHLLHLGKLKR